jgi:hypothetical protein
LNAVAVVNVYIDIEDAGLMPRNQHCPPCFRLGRTVAIPE